MGEGVDVSSGQRVEADVIHGQSQYEGRITYERGDSEEVVGYTVDVGGEEITVQIDSRFELFTAPDGCQIASQTGNSDTYFFYNGKQWIMFDSVVCADGQKAFFLPEAVRGVCNNMLNYRHATKEQKLSILTKQETIGQQWLVALGIHGADAVVLTDYINGYVDTHKRNTIIAGMEGLRVTAEYVMQSDITPAQLKKYAISNEEWNSQIWNPLLELMTAESLTEEHTQKAREALIRASLLRVGAYEKADDIISSMDMIFHQYLDGTLKTWHKSKEAKDLISVVELAENIARYYAEESLEMRDEALAQFFVGDNSLADILRKYDAEERKQVANDPSIENSGVSVLMSTIEDTLQGRDVDTEIDASALWISALKDPDRLVLLIQKLPDLQRQIEQIALNNITDNDKAWINRLAAVFGGVENRIDEIVQWRNITTVTPFSHAVINQAVAKLQESDPNITVNTVTERFRNVANAINALTVEKAEEGPSVFTEEEMKEMEERQKGILEQITGLVTHGIGKFESYRIGENVPKSLSEDTRDNLMWATNDVIEYCQTTVETWEELSEKSVDERDLNYLVWVLVRERGDWQSGVSLKKLQTSLGTIEEIMTSGRFMDSNERWYSQLSDWVTQVKSFIDYTKQIFWKHKDKLSDEQKRYVLEMVNQYTSGDRTISDDEINTAFDNLFKSA